MREDLYYDLYAKEQDYWWHVGKRAIVYGLLNRALGKRRRGLRALDVGCGTGHNLEHLSGYGEAAGTDYYEEALQFCRQRGHRLLFKADAASLPVSDRSFDIITALDVVEHLDDDVAALTEMRRVMRRGGVLVVSVPAYRILWSYWDEILGHRRRYTTRSLTEAVEKSGLRVQRVSYSNAIILVPAMAVRLLKALRQGAARRAGGQGGNPETDFMPVPGWTNKLLIAYYRVEARLLQRATLPFGLSVVCVARRTD